MSDSDTSTLKPNYLSVREVLGARAQSVAAMIGGAYTFLGGMFIAQMLCPLFGAGG